MATQGTVVLRSNITIGNNYIDSVAAYTKYTMGVYSGAWPTTKYKIVSATMTCTIRDAANKYSVVTAKTGNTTLGGFSTGGANGEKTASLTKAYAYAGLTSLDLYGASPYVQIATSTYVTVTVVWELDDVPSTFTLSASSVTAGNSVTATLSVYRSSYTHVLQYKFGTRTVSYTLAAGTTTQAITVPLAWLDQIPSSKTGTGTVSLQTLDGTRVLGTATAVLIVEAPSSTAPSFTLAVSPLYTVGGVSYPNLGIYVQGKCGYQVSLQNPTTQYSAWIASYHVTGGGYAGTTASFASGLLTVSGNVQITATVTDSRGYSTTQTQTIYVNAYSVPWVTSFQGWRTDASGAETLTGTQGKCKAVWSYTTLAGVNSCTASCTLAPKGGTAAAISAAMVSNTEYALITGGAVAALDITKVYVLTLTLTDAYGSVAFITEIPSANFGIHFNALGTSVGFGKFCEHSNAVEIATGRELYLGGKTLKSWILDMFFPIGAVYLSASTVSPAATMGGTWVRIKDRFLWAAGDNDTPGSIGGQATVALTQAELPAIWGKITGWSGSGAAAYGIFRETAGAFYPIDAAGTWYASSPYAPDRQQATPWYTGVPSYQGAVLNLGGGLAHTNMPPYQVFYAWWRSA